MALQALLDTKIPMIYQTGMYSEKMMNVSWEYIDKILTTLVAGTAECLAAIKSKDYPVAFVFRQTNEEFIAASMVEYFEGAKGEAGNWSLTWTFDEKDIPDNARRVSIFDNDFISFFKGSAFNRYGMIFDQNDYANTMFTYLLTVIKKYLLDNASETEEWGVKLDGVIQFRVAIEDGEKVISAEPDGEIKQLIKDDASIEV